MVDASTQYSPPQPREPASLSATTAPTGPSQTPTSTIAALQISETDDHRDNNDDDDDDDEDDDDDSAEPSSPHPVALKSDVAHPHPQAKRHAADSALTAPLPINGSHVEQDSQDHSPIKKPRPDAPPARKMPRLYELCNTRDLVVLISSMLMELIRYNDAIPLREGHLTRFHSRAPPAISVLDYLQRLTTHATLPPPILLSMVYYIDRLCTLYPAFTITSLTVHRFLITSATVASKGLSDSFWTNKTYAKVGGVSMKELALLELEFLTKMEWRIVPKPEVLSDYYKSLIGRNSQYELDT
ncbi:hypothetical protein LTR84_010142 [Exophiala bonariae]|uniref:Nuc-1 negative regulatory protein preg n=1 Tax=Exophiala bonariae TaxID=1690606 RepID=A0AAV9MTP1_9EURO|nr:hypothetical protein LTR84_010142 [Exophiala bonariae]